MKVSVPLRGLVVLGLQVNNFRWDSGETVSVPLRGLVVLGLKPTRPSLTGVAWFPSPCGD